MSFQVVVIKEPSVHEEASMLKDKVDGVVIL